MGGEAGIGDDAAPGTGAAGGRPPPSASRGTAVAAVVSIALAAAFATAAWADRTRLRQYADVFELVDESNVPVEGVGRVVSFVPPRSLAGASTRCVAILGTGISCYQEVRDR